MFMPRISFEDRIIFEFDFLVSEYGYSGPVKWNIAYEMEFTYTKQLLFVNISYDGAFFVSVGQIRKEIEGFASGRILLKDIDHRNQLRYDITDLISAVDKNELYTQSDPFAVLAGLAGVMRQNPEILNGDWHKFSIRHRLKQKLLS